jgi:hypothetical protein
MVAIGPYGDDPVKYPLDALPEMKKLGRKQKTFNSLMSLMIILNTHGMLGIKKTPTAVVLQKKAKRLPH